MSTSFPKHHRLLDKKAFSAVFDGNPVKASGASGMLLSVSSCKPQSRLGVIVAKKNVRHATKRNRIKRIVREHFRLNPLPAPIDVIFLARRGAAEKSNAELRTDIAAVWQKLLKKRERP